jgi:hypothetical protein
MQMQDYEWLVAAIADEIAADAQDAAAVTARLRSRLGYGCADPGFGAEAKAAQARIDLVERIAARLDRRTMAAAPVRLLGRDGIAA